jgi:hypothetical protein
MVKKSQNGQRRVAFLNEACERVELDLDAILRFRALGKVLATEAQKKAILDRWWEACCHYDALRAQGFSKEYSAKDLIPYLADWFRRNPLAASTISNAYWDYPIREFPPLPLSLGGAISWIPKY